MPNYGFICNKCEHRFEEFLLMEKRNAPLKRKCPSCSEKKSVVKDFGETRSTLGADATMNANTVTGGKWNELMSRMKRRMGKKYNDVYDTASKKTGRHWSG